MQDASLNPPITFRITPIRVGRYADVDPWDEALGDHNSTADIVAGRILKKVRPHLISRDIAIEVDLKRGTWKINGGRYGRGRIEEVSRG